MEMIGSGRLIESRFAALQEQASPGWNLTYKRSDLNPWL